MGIFRRVKDLEDAMGAIIDYLGVDLEKQEGYKVVKQEPLGFRKRGENDKNRL